jgi:hypothetical protein
MLKSLLLACFLFACPAFAAPVPDNHATVDAPCDDGNACTAEPIVLHTFVAVDALQLADCAGIADCAGGTSADALQVARAFTKTERPEVPDRVDDARFSRAHFEFIQYCSAKAKRHVQTGRFTNADC